MRRAPGTSFAVIASLGVAMAVSATVFSFVNALLVRTLSVSDPQRLVAVESTDPKTTQPTGFYGDAFAVFQASQASFTAVSLHSPGSYRVSARGVTSDVAADGVTSEFRSVLGMRMVAGRFVSGGERPVRPGDQPHEAVISERLWARVFGSDPQAVGERIAVDGIEVAIVGIAAANPDGLDPESLTPEPRDWDGGLAFRRAHDDLAGECATFLLTGLVAAFVPSLRASRVEPSEALRHE